MRQSRSFSGMAKVGLMTLLIALPAAIGIGMGSLPLFSAPATGMEAPVRELLILVGIVTSIALMVFFYCGGYQLTSQGLVVRSQFHWTKIPFRAIQSITETRSSRKARRQLAITYLKTGKPATIGIAPKNVEAFTHDLLQRCPQLTGFEETRLKKDRSFAEAIGQS